MPLEDRDVVASTPQEGRPPTMLDVARRAGVSRQLVSLVIRDEPGPSEASREKVLRVAEELGFHPNSSAQLLRQSRTMTIGACFLIQNPFQSNLVERLFGALGEHGYRLSLAPVTVDRPLDAAIADLMQQRVEAVVAFNPDPASSALAAAVDRLPVVWLGERDPTELCDNVRVDEGQGLDQVIEHLTGLGHTHISYAGGLQGITGPDRRSAYEDAMRKHGLAGSIDVLPGGFDEEDGASAARSILDRTGSRPTALVCCSDQSAAGALVTFARAGLNVPKDISLVGFDDGRVAAMSFNDLTSVHQDVDVSVSATVEMLLARLRGDAPAERRSVLVPTSLTVRSSVAAVRSDG